MYGIPKSVCAVPVIPMSIQVLLPYVLPVFLHVGSYLPTQEPESWITGVCSPHVISLSDLAYYVFGQEPAAAVHPAPRYVLLVCHQHDVCKNPAGGHGGLRESGPCVFRKLCPVCPPVAGKGPL